MRVKNEDLLNGSASADLSADWTSEPVWLGHIANYAIQLAFTSSPAGSLKLQASNDIGNPNSQSRPNQQSEVSNWTDIQGSSQTISATGDHMWNVQNAGYNWVRVVWTVSSGSGVLNTARCYVKGI